MFVGSFNKSTSLVCISTETPKVQGMQSLYIELPGSSSKSKSFNSFLVRYCIVFIVIHIVFVKFQNVYIYIIFIYTSEPIALRLRFK